MTTTSRRRLMLALAVILTVVLAMGCGGVEPEEELEEELASDQPDPLDSEQIASTEQAITYCAPPKTVCLKQCTASWWYQKCTYSCNCKMTCNSSKTTCYVDCGIVNSVVNSWGGGEGGASGGGGGSAGDGGDS